MSTAIRRPQPGSETERKRVETFALATSAASQTWSS
jgi:hypothetical protein